MSHLEQLIDSLRSSPAIRDKMEIARAYRPAEETTRGLIRLGDDCAAVADPSGGYLLLAAEGLLPDFVAEDPWFAGYSGVMVNVSDVCAMGGRPIAVVDVLWTPEHERTRPVWDGMKAAAKAYGVPIVGGHTTVTRSGAPVYLAASILGRAKALMTSFDAKPGDELLMAVDLNGNYRGEKPFWNASVGTADEKLRKDIELLPELAESGWCRAAKDISNGGVIGTLVMLLEASGVGARLELGALPKPKGVELGKWLLTFPSFGYLLSVAPENREAVTTLFSRRSLACRVVGEVTKGSSLEIRLDGESRRFWFSESQRVAHA